jgi:hypothetical protein
MFIGESSLALRRLYTPIFERPYASRTRDRAEIHVVRDEALRRSPQLRRGPLDRCLPRAGDAQPPLTAKAVKPNLSSSAGESCYATAGRCPQWFKLNA